MITTFIAPTHHIEVLSSLTQHAPSYPPLQCVHANSSRCHPTLDVTRSLSIESYLLPSITRARSNFFTLTFRALSKNHVVSTPHCSLLIEQPDSPCPFSVLDRYLLHNAPPMFPLAFACRFRRPVARRVPARGRALAISSLASGRTS